MHLGSGLPRSAIRTLAREPLIPELESSSQTGAKAANAEPATHKPSERRMLAVMAQCGDPLLHSITATLVD